ncbi:hypothetical protein [Peptostreptococcus sp. MV1]|uniref:hypothetical protein n=1 Tax=Peptostreptococcus sp. MV1 TaxID=1219626 RepID=UPI00055CA471|nr:hypothetical protein [Peptostreptococcus sp. MV1]
MLDKNKSDNMSCKNKKFFDFVEKHLNDFVEIDSYLSRSKLYGIVSEYDDLSLTLSRTDMDEKNPHYNNQKVLYVPLNSIKSIKIL